MATGDALPTLYIPHGGGPCFFMEWNPPDTWKRMGRWLSDLAAAIGARPRAIVVISAHWEEAAFTVMTNPHPKLFYDYYGFPPHTYALRYDAPGDPALAARVASLLKDAGLATGSDAERGFDHGVFIPFKLIYPDADIPIIQLSLQANLDPALHIAAGRALAPLREEGVLIVGSGMSYHNMTAFRGGAAPQSEAFDAWLDKAISGAAPQAAQERLSHWQEAPGARAAHPREEHLLPLMVAAGAGGEDIGHRVFTDRVMGAVVSAFRFG
jgi:aromatic ring-opening dioxygenase catalytic subunit (LigB family)